MSQKCGCQKHCYCLISVQSFSAAAQTQIYPHFVVIVWPSLPPLPVYLWTWDFFSEYCFWECFSLSAILDHSWYGVLFPFLFASFIVSQRDLLHSHCSCTISNRKKKVVTRGNLFRFKCNWEKGGELGNCIAAHLCTAHWICEICSLLTEKSWSNKDNY